MTLDKLNLDGSSSVVDGKDNDEIIGIDLGTTNSAVAVFDADLISHCLPIGDGGSMTVQSCVRWDGGDKFTVGAKAYVERYKSNVCYSVKRIMGSDQVVTFVRDNGDKLELSPAQVSGIILRELADRTERVYKPVKKCIITVPAYFNQRQIRDTVEASKLAGLDCVQILKEPTSASYVYSMLGYAQNGAILIYDLGGGTFDVTHMRFARKDAVPKTMVTSLKKQYGIEVNAVSGNSDQKYFCRVLGTYGDMHLGGDDIDTALAKIVLGKKKIPRESFEKLVLNCEEYKKQDCYGAKFTVDGVEYNITQTQLNQAIDQVFDRTMALLDGVDLHDVKTIVLVGGSTKSKRIREDLAKAFPGVEISAVLNPDETVALGAGCVAKAVANCDTLSYQDVLPLSIGILVDECNVDYCIQRNTAMPYSVNRRFYTLYDNQEVVQLMLFQGLSTDYKECTFIGQVVIDGIPRGKAGDIPIDVSLSLNAQGRLSVVSKVKGVEKERELIINNIFDVARQESQAKEADPDILGNGDEFEGAFYELLKDNLKAVELFWKRRDASGQEERDSLEEQIVALL